ncbi:MAG: hypothetical protein QXK47_02360 [Candidatus Bathyarchaeia archaeon]
MPRKKRILLIEETLKKCVIFFQIQTQELRVKLIQELEKLFTYSKRMAETADNSEDWVKICTFIAQTINSLARSYDEVRLNEQMKELEQLIEEAKKRAGKTQTGTPVA